MPTPSEKPAICGSIHPATAEGFREFLREANEAARDGYDLVTLIRLEKGMASVFRRARRVATDAPGSFFEDSL